MASSNKKPVAKKPAPKKVAAKKPAPKKPAPKKVAVKKPVAKKPAPKKVAAKKPAPKKVAVKKPAPKKVAAKKPVAKKPAPKKAAPAKAVAKKVAAAPSKKAAPAKAVVKKVAPAPPKKVAPKPFVRPPVPGKKPKSKDGIISNKDFDLTFLRSQRQLLLAKRSEYLGQAEQLDHERELLIEATGMSDDQFDEEGGEGDTLAVERERAKLLSDQDRLIVKEIDAALERIASGDYGYSLVSTKPIPRERLEFIP